MKINVMHLVIQIVVLFAFIYLFIMGLIAGGAEELFFLLMFIGIVVQVYKYFGSVIKVVLEDYSEQIYKEYIKIMLEKAKITYILIEWGKKIKYLEEEIDDLIMFFNEIIDSIKNENEKNFEGILLLSKHKQIKVALIEGINYIKFLEMKQYDLFNNTLLNFVQKSANEGVELMDVLEFKENKKDLIELFFFELDLPNFSSEAHIEDLEEFGMPMYVRYDIDLEVLKEDLIFLYLFYECETYIE